MKISTQIVNVYAGLSRTNSDRCGSPYVDAGRVPQIARKRKTGRGPVTLTPTRGGAERSREATFRA
jgi:hypothetical protein